MAKPQPDRQTPLTQESLSAYIQETSSQKQLAYAAQRKARQAETGIISMKEEGA